MWMRMPYHLAVGRNKFRCRRQGFSFIYSNPQKSVKKNLEPRFKSWDSSGMTNKEQKPFSETFLVGVQRNKKKEIPMKEGVYITITPLFS